MTNSLPNQENRFLDCLRMELEIKPIQLEGCLNKLLQKAPKQIDLVLNIRFGEHQEHLREGSVTFGLKRGELKVEITNGEVRLKNFKLKNEFQNVFEKEIQSEEETEGQIGTKISVSLEVTTGIKAREKTAKKVKYNEYQVGTKGPLNEPSWTFEVKTDKKFLQGLLQNAELATIDIKAKPCSLVATFISENIKDICITDAYWRFSNSLQYNITKKRTAVIERAVVRHFLEEKVKQKPYLSRAELTYE